jgi:chaperone BCS1
MDFVPLGENPFLTGGLVLMLAGGLLYYLKRLPYTIYAFVERFFIVKIELLDDDESYQWMQVWLADKLHQARSISVVTRRSNPHSADVDDQPQPNTAGGKPAVYLVPAVGTYFFWYQGRFVTLNRSRDENSAAMPLVGGAGGATSLARPRESFTLRIFSRDRALARRLIEECRARALPDDGKLDIRVAQYGCWSLGTRIRPRPLDSVILDGAQAEELHADMRAFLGSRAWYEQVGVPYRRGYLLHGPPGNGKTSVVKALAGELGMSIYLLMLSDPDMTDSRVSDLLAKVPDRNILLLEDVDCAFTRRRRIGGRSGGLTFSGLLNAIDGVAAPEGRIIVMTTNHLDRLDPALIRPGRADVRLYIGDATAMQAGRLFARFFPEAGERGAEFAQLAQGQQFSMATLQDFLMLHRHDPEEALSCAGEIGTLQLRRAPSVPPAKPCRRGDCLPSSA